MTTLPQRNDVLVDRQGSRHRFIRYRGNDAIIIALSSNTAMPTLVDSRVLAAQIAAGHMKFEHEPASALQMQPLSRSAHECAVRRLRYIEQIAGSPLVADVKWRQAAIRDASQRFAVSRATVARCLRLFFTGGQTLAALAPTCRRDGGTDNNQQSTVAPALARGKL